MYDTNSFKKGLRVEIDKTPYIMMEVEFVKPGKGQAFTRVKMRNMLSGGTLSRTYKSGEKIKPADLLDKEMQFLYATDGIYHFMDNKSFEQYEVTKEATGDGWKWLVDNMFCNVTLFNGQPIAVNLPNFSILKVTQCDPSVRGDTVNNATKIATLQTGATVQVPLFVEQGEKVRIDTRKGLYVDRIK